MPAAGQAVSAQRQRLPRGSGNRRHCLGTALLNTVRQSLMPYRSEDSIFPGFSQQAQTSQQSVLRPAPVFVQVVQSCVCMSTALCTNLCFQHMPVNIPQHGSSAFYWPSPTLQDGRTSSSFPLMQAGQWQSGSINESGEYRKSYPEMFLCHTERTCPEHPSAQDMACQLCRHQSMGLKKQPQLTCVNSLLNGDEAHR